MRRLPKQALPLWLADLVAASFIVDQSRLREVAMALRAVLPAISVSFSDEDARPDESSGLSAYRQLPVSVALPVPGTQILVIQHTF